MNQTASRRDTKIVVERSYRATLKDVWELWTTKEGFESWWGPQGFYVKVHEFDAREGGVLRYDMVAGTPEMIAAMKEMGQGVSHVVKARFTELKPRSRLVITNLIDFLPGVPRYESDIDVDLFAEGDRVRMVVTLYGMHDAETSGMQKQGFESQLTKLDARFA